MKSYRDKEIKYLYIVFSILFIATCTPYLNDSTFINSFEKLQSIIGDIVLIGSVSLISFIFDSLVDCRRKDRLIYVIKKPKSGANIFTRLKLNKVEDNRFSNRDACLIYKDIIENIPNDEKLKEKYENSQWYVLLKKCKDCGSVQQCHRDYLLCRDLFIHTILFMVILIFFRFIFYSKITISIQFILIWFFVLIITNIATRNKMSRFVNTVIAEDIALHLCEK